MKALLSIKPEFAEKIFSGEKGYEFRKAAFSQDVTSVIVYVTAPVGRIVGEFEVANIWQDTPTSLWQKTKESAGISAQFFFEYFKGRNKAVAIEIAKPKRYKKEINPYSGEKKFTPPQSFCYVTECHHLQLALF
ncbi:MULTISPECIES: ASCH domain-containing protein [Desulfovibrio]|uniref:ASCH domain-containing protein n=1 Tax=Desulfovibrio TaxID=872 RepID=UPI001C0103D2|nr:ASCH domain-containing protein [Desulfovibrio sp.]MBT9750214.1 ASCH domain-containing protein [Desulfovibrio desulfuricans]HZF61957.1 ASCH domain-containing protein [Desulfovibrio sp.]